MDSESSQEKREAKRVSQEIDSYLKEEARKLDPKNHIHVLLLGPGDAGKSTVLKQLIMQNGGFKEQERKDHTDTIQKQMLSAARIIIQFVTTSQSLWDSKETEEAAHYITNTQIDLNNTLSADILRAMLYITQSNYARQVLLECDEYGIPDTCKQYFTNAATILNPSYIATDEDILLARRKTEKMSETILPIDGKSWHFIDVSGQKDKRNRWATYMQKNIQGVVYVLSCAAYNQVLEEERELNRVVDAHKLFVSILESPILKLSSVVVMFNKFDLLDEKIKNYPIKKYLLDYPGEQDKNSYLTWLIKLFQKAAQDKKVEMSVFKTTATDKNLMLKVLGSVRNFIVAHNISDVGLA
ncbi:guanine nucleotide binding protein, alpha subunit [Gorgonomyces haynaldii]|nr:guanine nucleotide binding protein, alpha subunit [Gorgonomyces haynaldii]